jgi:hypothetical protein
MGRFLFGILQYNGHVLQSYMKGFLTVNSDFDSDKYKNFVLQPLRKGLGHFCPIHPSTFLRFQIIPNTSP